MTATIGDVRVTAVSDGTSWTIAAERISTGEQLNRIQGAMSLEQATRCFEASVKQWTEAAADDGHALHEYTEVPVWH